MGRIAKYVFIAAFACILAASGALVYFYTHPEAVVKIVEASAARFAGISIGRLFYSVAPLYVRMEEISIAPAEGSSGFSLKIPKLSADLQMEGRFGNKTLVLKMIRIDGFSLEYDQTEFKMPTRPHASDSLFMPVLKHLTAFFLFRDIRLQEIAVEGGAAAAALPDLSVAAEEITAGRNADRQVEFRADARILLRSQNGRLHIPNLHLLTADSVSLSEMKVTARLSATGASFESDQMSVAGIGLTVDGALDLKERRLDAPLFTFQVADAVAVKGNLNAWGGRRKELGVRVEEARLLPLNLMAMAPEGVGEILNGLNFSGEVSAKGAFKASLDGNRWDYAYGFDFRLMKNPIFYTAGNHRFGGDVEGDLSVRGDSGGAEIETKLNAAAASYSDRERSLKFSDVSVSLAGRHPEYRIADLSARISQVSGIPMEGKLPLEDFRFQVRNGMVNGQSGALRLPLVEMESPWIQKVTARIESDADAFRIRIDKGSGLIAAAKSRNLIPAGWQLSGSDSFALRLNLAGMETLSIDLTLRLESLAFQDADAVFAGDGIGLEFRFNGRLDLQDLSTAGTASLQTASGELLYDLFYFDLKKHPFSATYEGVFDPAGKHLRLARLDFGLKQALRLDVSGRLELSSPARGNLRIKVPEVPIAPFFRLFVVEPFQSERPYLSGVEMEGKMSADLEAGSTGPAGRIGWSVKGRIRWEEGLFSVKEKGIHAAGIHLEYPLWYQSNAGTESGEPIEGKAAVSLKLGPVIDQVLRIEMAAGKNSLRIPAFPEIELPWGSLSTGPIQVTDLYSETRTVRTALSFSPLDVTPLLSGTWPNMEKAILQGRLDSVVIRGDRVETEGKLTLEAFGGSVVLSDLGADRFSTDSPVLKVDAETDGIRLGPLTEGTGFGKIEGVLAGYARNLEIAYGQPQRFDLLLETVERKGVPQKISIKAVENIARIGGGQSPFMGLAGAFTALFETLNYEKIGVRSSLENDLFRLNGTIVEGGKEYFIKGSLIAGVNIINQNPDNRIRFKDMVKRVQRITSETGKPAIE